MPLAIKQQNISQHENEMIRIKQLIIARYATVSPVIKMSNMRGFGIHILNYFCLSIEEMGNQYKKIRKPQSQFLFYGIIFFSGHFLRTKDL